MSKHTTTSLLVLLGPLLAFAEQPDRGLVADRLLAIRRHSTFPTLPSGQHQGLWTLEPDTLTWERLRHLSYNADLYFGTGGGGCALASTGDLVRFQAWPVNLDFDAASWRMVGRSSPVDDPAAAVGWTVQGPLIGPDDAAEVGLVEGTYGIGRCFWVMLPWLTPWDPAPCSDYRLPGSGVPIGPTADEPWPLLYRDGAGHLSLAGRLTPWQWGPVPDTAWGFKPTLSLDLERVAFWRGTPRGVELVPIVNGSVGPPTLSEAFDFPPFDEPVVETYLVHYHPRRHLLFVNTFRYSRFLTVSPSLELLADHSLGDYPLVALTSLGAAPTLFEQLLAILAHTPGRNDTFWTSDLWLYNPSPQPTTVTLRRVAAPAETRSVELPARGSVRIADALAVLGGGPAGDGATHDGVVLTAPYRWGEQVVAASRTSTAAPGGGTFGHAVTAAPGRAGYSNHLVWPGEPEPDWAEYVPFRVPFAGPSNLNLDRRSPGRFRHNLGVVNDFDEPVTLTLLWGHMETAEYYFPYEMATRPASALQTVEVPPHSVRIVQLESLFPAEVAEVWPPRIGVWGTRPVALWLSMVDNLTGDATFVPFTDFAWGSDLWTSDNFAVRVAVPVVTHGPGAAGSSWRTDLYGAEWLAQGYHARAWLHPSNLDSDCGGAGATSEVTDDIIGELAMPASQWFEDWGLWHSVAPDVARAFIPCAEDQDLHAGLELLSASWQSGYTRTYTTRDDGGTYGEMLPFYPEGGWPVQHFAGVEVGSTFRVNVGLFNGDGEHAITHRITLYSADGQVAAERTITLQPYASLQRSLEHLFRMESGSLPPGTYGMTVLPLDDPQHGIKGRSWAWVSLVDNVTNDPTNWW